MADRPAGPAGAARPRVLWLTQEPPDRALGGGNIRQAHLLAGLAAHADVTLLVIGPLRDPAVRAAVAEVVEVRGVDVPRPQRRAVRRLHDLWIAVRGPREVVLTAGCRRAVRRTVRRLEHDHDLVVATHLGMAALRPRRPAVPWVAQLHHVSSARAAQEQDVTPGRRQRWLLAREVGHARRFERWVRRAFDAVSVVSEDDARLLGAPVPPAAAGRVRAVPNGVDVDRYRPSPLPTVPAIAMTGSLQYGPNVDGAVWFCAEVLPRLRREVPEATLSIVGREPRDEVVAAADRPGVTLHADVPDVAPYLAAARATVVPLRIGTGTRLKALESMAAGRPVVGTSIGLEGLEVTDGRQAHVADDADAMAAALARVLTDDAHASAMAAAGRRLVVERFDWSAIADAYARWLLGGPPW